MQAPSWTDFLQCSICMSKYNCMAVVPVSLHCCHTICKRCFTRLKTNTCPYDRTPVPPNMSTYPPNTALLLLLGFQSDDWSHEMINLCPKIIPESEFEGYTDARNAIEKLAIFLKPFTEQGVLQATATIPRPVLKKLVTLLNCQILDGEGRSKALRAAYSIAERTITELLIMHQNPQQIPSLLWTTVRNRGCQFLGPIMQEEALKLIQKVLESGSFLSRKNIVLYVVQQLQSDFPNASKTNIGHVVQLLYRASCFNVEKREDESSLMQLKEEYRTYESLRREHDAQIIKIAMEAGLRITPETWSTQLYGNTSRKSDMQSIIDKLVSLGVSSSGLSELIIAIGRSQDPQNLSEKLIPHLDALLKTVSPTEKNTEKEPTETIVNSWDSFTKGINELLSSLQVFTEFTQIISGRYKTGMCPYLTKSGGCPRGHLCPYAHTEDERRKYVNIAKTSKRAGTGVGKQTKNLQSSHSMTTLGGGVPPLRRGRYSEEFPMDSPYSSLEESTGHSSFPSGTVMCQPDPRASTTFLMQSPGSGLPIMNVGAQTHPGITSTTTMGYYQNPSLLEGYNSSGPYGRVYIGDAGGGGVRGVPLDYFQNKAGSSVESTSSFPYEDSSMSYHPSTSQLHIYPGKSDMSSKDNIPVTSSQYFSPELDKVDDPTTPTSVPTSFEESRKYKYPSVSSDHISSGEDEGESKPDSFGLQYSMAQLNFTNTDPHSSESVHSSSQNPKSSDVESGSGVMISRGGRTQHSNPQPSQGIDVNNLHARIQHLEAELERSRRPSNHSGELGGVSYQPNFPSQFYGSSPHHMEPIGRSNFSGPIPLQYSPNHSGILPSMHTEGGYYHPLTGGLPGHIPGHPWSGPMATMVVSPAGSVHSTPPNTQLLLQSPSPAQRMPHHHVAPMIPQDHYTQIESDAMIAHYLQFVEQSKAVTGGGYPIAPGAPIPPTHHHHHHHPVHGPVGHPSGPYGFNYRVQPHIITSKQMYK